MSGRSLLLGVVAAIVVGAACGGDDGDAAAPATPTETTADGAAASTWEGRLELDLETGEVRAPGFNEMIDDLQPTWANTVRGAAGMLVVDVEGVGETEMRVEGDSTAVVTVTGLEDDSAEAVRYELHFRRGDDNLFRFENGSWSQRCQPGRGHDDQFLAEPCV